MKHSVYRLQTWNSEVTQSAQDSMLSYRTTTVHRASVKQRHQLDSKARLNQLDTMLVCTTFNGQHTAIEQLSIMQHPPYHITVYGIPQGRLLQPPLNCLLSNLKLFVNQRNNLIYIITHTAVFISTRPCNDDGSCYDALEIVGVIIHIIIIIIKR